jgi:hypothetical protein
MKNKYNIQVDNFNNKLLYIKGHSIAIYNSVDGSIIYERVLYNDEIKSYGFCMEKKWK